MADTRLIGVRKEKKNIWLDKARDSSQINKTDHSLLTWSIYNEGRTDIVYRPTLKKIHSLNTKFTIRAN